MTILVSAVVATAAALTSCSGQQTPPAAGNPSSSSTLPVVADPAAAKGFMAMTLATGQIPSLPAGPLYVDIEHVPSGPVPSTPLTRDCMVYTLSGSQAVVDASSATSSATAVFMGPHGASYPKTGNAVVADALCLRPSSDHGHGPAMPGGTSIFASGDFAYLTAPGPYRAQLALVTIQPGGRGAAHVHSGPETLLATGGTTTYHLGGPTPVDLNGAPSPVTRTVGQAMTHQPNQPIQDFNTGDGVATALNFIVWPAGQSVRTDIHTAP
ncbi:MAG TPA: hypothetical protein VIY28_16560 [Pseudonocardiaceae bacterium]